MMDFEKEACTRGADGLSKLADADNGSDRDGYYSPVRQDLPSTADIMIRTVASKVLDELPQTIHLTALSQPASPETSSPANSPRKKRILDAPSSVLPQPKRRLFGEMTSTAPLLGYPTPANQYSATISAATGASIPSRDSVLSWPPIHADVDGPPPLPLAPDCGSQPVKQGRQARESGGDLLGPVISRSQLASDTDGTTPEALRQIDGFEDGGHSVSRLASPAEVEPAARQPSLGQHRTPTSGYVHYLGKQTEAGQFESPTTPRPTVESALVQGSKIVSHEGDQARLKRTCTLEGNPKENDRGGSNGHLDNANAPGEEIPITMCGDRLYSDWTGHWGKSSFSIPFSSPTSLSSHTSPRRGCSSQDPGSRRAISGGLSSSSGRSGAVDLPGARLPDSFRRSMGSWWAFQCMLFLHIPPGRGTALDNTGTRLG
ncbi:hypothetical protein VTK56DRAFT_10015 [Thermocarpiscus australiensis]